MAWSQAYRQRELGRILERMRAQGFTPRGDALEAAALVRFINGILGKAPGRGTSRRIAEAVGSLQDKANAVVLRNNPGIACRRGCSHCCKTFVSASAPQIFAIADYIRQHVREPAFERNRLGDAERRTRGVTIDDRYGIACPFLVDDFCSIYSVRPPPCRAAFSTDVQKCIAGDADIPMPFTALMARSVVDQALWSALHRRGLPVHSYEIGEAVMRVLDDPDAEERWYGGQDVFAGVAIDLAARGIGADSQAEASWRALSTIAEGLPAPEDCPFAHTLPKWCLA